MKRIAVCSCVLLFLSGCIFNKYDWVEVKVSNALIVSQDIPFTGWRRIQIGDIGQIGISQGPNKLTHVEMDYELVEQAEELRIKVSYSKGDFEPTILLQKNGSTESTSVGELKVSGGLMRTANSIFIYLSPNNQSTRGTMKIKVEQKVRSNLSITSS